MPSNLDDALHQHFGFTTFRQGQREAILAILAQHDALVVMPTGSGKSLVYQLSALLLPGLTLVVSPLIALMKDQVDALAARHIAATFINSTLSTDEQQARLAQLGAYKIVYVAPERLRNVAFRDALKQTCVSLLAVDEAHCISQWGHDFRPDYLRIREFADSIKRPTIIALTATATPQVQSDIVNQLGLVNATRIVTGFNRPNLALRVRYTPNETAKYRELENILSAVRDSVIVYTGTRRDAEQVAEFCNEVAKIPAAFYHAGMEDDERTRVQDNFMRDCVPVIAATNAFGMGVDKPDIRAVIHFALTSTVEAYYQEIGRAGRDGNPAQGILLYSPEDRALQEWFIENDAPESKQVRQLFQTICRMIQKSNWISPLVLQRETGLNDSKLQLALRQLEVAGAIRRLGDARGLIGVEIISNANPNLTESQADTEWRRAHRRKQLAKMIEYAETNGCRRKFILDYFGDTAKPTSPDCCDNHAAKSFENARPAQAEEEWTPLVILEIVRTLPRPVGCDKLALIAKGSQAQEIQKFGYNKLRYYGKLADYARAQLDDIIQELLRRGLLKIIGSEFPVVALSARGDEALRKRIAIELDLPALPSKHSAKRAEKRTTRQAGGTIERTLELARQNFTPAQIAEQRDLAISTILGHLEQLVTEGKIEADRFIEPAVREQILAAMRLWDGQWLSGLKELLPAEISYDQIRFVVAAEKARQHEPPTETQPAAAAVAQFLTRAHPKALRGPWDCGFALDSHSKFVGAQNLRTELGDLMYRFKYNDEKSLGEIIAARVASFIATHPELQVDLLLPIPSTQKERAYDPVPLLARLISNRIGIPMSETALVKTRQTQPQKEMQVLAQKSANVAGAFRITDTSIVRGKRVLLLDDLYDSGATLAEAAQVLRKAGAAQICVLAVTKTIHSD